MPDGGRHLSAALPVEKLAEAGTLAPAAKVTLCWVPTSALVHVTVALGATLIAGGVKALFFNSPRW